MLRDLLTFIATGIGAGTVVGVFVGGLTIEVRDHRGVTTTRTSRLVERYGVLGQGKLPGYEDDRERPLGHRDGE